MEKFNLLLVCVIFYVSFLEIDVLACGSDEEPTDCAPCDQHCDNVTRACPMFCMVNSTLCRCKTGFVRDSNNACILPSQCNQTCGINETPVTCPPCDGTCNNTKPICFGPICFGNQTFCACKSGYVRDSNRNCMPISQCNRTCDSIKCSPGQVCKMLFPPCPFNPNNPIPCQPIPTCLPGNSTIVKPCNMLCVRGDVCINGRCVPTPGPIPIPATQ
uniref:TIL domain-containing protein n=1 Tax=Acrobeloides nanus TaxID=290746 RepID=A0A914E9J3_9BILA